MFLVSLDTSDKLTYEVGGRSDKGNGLYTRNISPGERVTEPLVIAPVSVCQCDGAATLFALTKKPGPPRRVGRCRAQPAGSGLNPCTVTQHVPWGLWFVLSLHCDDGGTLLWIFTTWYWVGP